MSDLFTGNNGPDDNFSDNSSTSPNSGSSFDKGMVDDTEKRRALTFAPLAGSPADLALSRAIKSQRLGSSLLFHGPEGVGKWWAALSLAAFLNCQRRNSESALTGHCGNCPPCRQMFATTFADLVLAFPTPSAVKESDRTEYFQEFVAQKIENPLSIVRWSKVSGISINVAREIKRRLAKKADSGSWRVVLFYQVEKMTPGAVDSLLRMIEEPPPQTVFILISDQPSAVAPTALSRCQRIRFGGFSVSVITNYLRKATSLGESHLATVARLAQGSPGRALEIAAEFVDTSEEGGSAREVSWMVFKSLFLSSPAETVDLLTRNVDMRNRSAVDLLINRWESFLRDLTLASEGREELIANVDLVSDIRRFSTAIHPGETLYSLSDSFTYLRENLRLNITPQLALADLVFTMQAAFAPHSRA